MASVQTRYSSTHSSVSFATVKQLDLPLPTSLYLSLYLSPPPLSPKKVNNTMTNNKARSNPTRDSILVALTCHRYGLLLCIPVPDKTTAEMLSKTAATQLLLNHPYMTHRLDGSYEEAQGFLIDTTSTKAQDYDYGIALLEPGLIDTIDSWTPEDVESNPELTRAFITQALTETAEKHYSQQEIIKGDSIALPMIAQISIDTAIARVAHSRSLIFSLIKNTKDNKMPLPEYIPRSVTMFNADGEEIALTNDLNESIPLQSRPETPETPEANPTPEETTETTTEGNN